MDGFGILWLVLGDGIAFAKGCGSFESMQKIMNFNRL